MEAFCPMTLSNHYMRKAPSKSARVAWTRCSTRGLIHQGALRLPVAETAADA